MNQFKIFVLVILVLAFCAFVWLGAVVLNYYHIDMILSCCIMFVYGIILGGFLNILYDHVV